MSHRRAPLSGLLLLLAAVGLLPASPAQSPANTPTTLQPNSGAVGPALLQEGTYARFTSDIPLTEEYSLVTVYVETTKGDVDLYMSDTITMPTRDFGGYHWRSNRLGTRDEETIMTIFPASSTPKLLHLAVYCYNGVQQVLGDGSYQQLCEHSITVTVAALAALSTTLSNRQSPQTATSLTVGQYKFLRFDVQRSGLTEVHMEISTSLEGAVGTPRVPITVVTSLRPAMTLVQQRSDVAVTEGRDGRLGHVRTNRGQPVEFTLYVDAPVTLWVSINNGLVPPEVWEDKTVPVRAAAWTQPVTMSCVLPDRMESLTHSVAFDHAHFWALPLQDEQMIHRLELQATTGLVALSVNTQTGEWPLPMDASTTGADRSYCGNDACTRSLRAEAVAETSGSVAAQAVELCRRAHGHSAAASFHKFVLFSVKGSVLGMDSEYVLRAMQLDETCGWRPSCDACGEGGSACTWCGRFGGYCDTLTTAAAEYNLCQQAAWCADPSPCAAAQSCESCGQLSNCGWCGNAGAKGICTEGAAAGPTLGVCDAWLYGPDADCDRQCTIHEQAPAAATRCDACAQEPACGYCHSPFHGGCMPGNTSMAADGSCPADNTQWVHHHHECYRVTGKLPEDVEPIVVGQQQNITLSLSEDGACYLGACAFAVLAVPLRAGRVANLRASLAVSPSHANVAAYVSHRHVPTADDHDAAAMPQRQLPLLDPPLGEGEAGYSLAAGFCQEVDAELVFVLLMLQEDSAASEVHVRLRVDEEDSGIVVEPVDGARGELPDQQVCCGGMRQHSLLFVGDGGDSGTVSIVVEKQRDATMVLPNTYDADATYSTNATTTSYVGDANLLQVYARAGVCPTRTTFDHWQAAAHGPLVLPLLQDGVRWHIGVAGAAPLAEGGGLGTAVQHVGLEQLYTMSYQVRLDGDGLFGMGAGSKAAVAGVAGIGAAAGLVMVAMLWAARVAVKRRRRIRASKHQPLDSFTAINMLALDFDGLSGGGQGNGMELALRGGDTEQGLLERGREHSEGAALTQAGRGRLDKAKLLSGFNPVFDTQADLSVEEEELVDLIESMADKIARLEDQNEMLQKETIRLIEASRRPGNDGGAASAPPPLVDLAGDSGGIGPGDINLDVDPFPSTLPGEEAALHGAGDNSISTAAVAASVSGLSDIFFPNRAQQQQQQQQQRTAASSSANPLLSMAAASVSGMSAFPDDPMAHQQPSVGGTEDTNAALRQLDGAPPRAHPQRPAGAPPLVSQQNLVTLTAPAASTSHAVASWMGMAAAPATGPSSSFVPAPPPGDADDRAPAPPAAVSTTAPTAAAASAAATAVVPASQFPPLPTPAPPPAPAPPPPRFRVQLVCPDGTALLCSSGVQTVGRGMGGVVSKKASREQATLTVDVHTGMVELTVLGKNGMMWRPEEDQPWTHLPRSGTARLRTHSEFSLLGRIDPDDTLARDRVVFMVLIKDLSTE